MPNSLRKIVRKRQVTGSYCGPAVMAMLLSVFGKRLSQTELVDATGMKEVVMKDGITLKELAGGLKKLYPDYVVWVKMGSKIEDLYRMIKAGYLVGVDWQGVFDRDEYGDDEEEGRIRTAFRKLIGEPFLEGLQGHYCIVTGVNLKEGFIKFIDPYGHYSGRDRFIATWEFEERWWDDRIDIGEDGKKKYVLEKKMAFVVTTKGDRKPEKLGMKVI